MPIALVRKPLRPVVVIAEILALMEHVHHHVERVLFLVAVNVDMNVVITFAQFYVAKMLKIVVQIVDRVVMDIVHRNVENHLKIAVEIVSQFAMTEDVNVMRTLENVPMIALHAEIVFVILENRLKIVVIVPCVEITNVLKGVKIKQIVVKIVEHYAEMEFVRDLVEKQLQIVVKIVIQSVVMEYVIVMKTH